MLWSVLENPLEHIPGAIGGGAITAVVTSLIWGYIYKRREDRRDREQSVVEAQMVIKEWREYADSVKEHADVELCKMQAALKNVEDRLVACESDRDTLHRAKRKLQNRIGVLEGKMGVEPSPDDEDSDQK